MSDAAMPGSWPMLVAAVLLVPLAGLFAALDSALNTVSRARVEEAVKDARPGGRRLLRIMNSRPVYVNLTVLLRTVAEVTAAVLFTGWLLGVVRSPGWSFAFAAVTMTVLVYVVVGVGPRTLGRQHAYTLALAAAGPLWTISVVLGPVTRGLILLGNAITPGRGFRNGPFASEIELREVVDMAQEHGVVDVTEGRMIQSVFELGETSARTVMVPRTEMVWIEREKTAGQATSLAVRSGYSRLPVVGETIDDVLGVVYLKDLVARTYTDTDGGEGVRVDEVMREAVFVPDSKPLDQLLAEMQRTRNHIAILVDEYGGVAGLVSIEDILEEIVGEIHDEYDLSELTPIAELDAGVWRVSARLSLDELTELTGVGFDDDVTDEVDTVGGLIAFDLGRVPLPGARIAWSGLELLAEGGSDRRGRIRVTTVVVRRVEPADAGHDDETATVEEGAGAAARLERTGEGR